MIGQLEVGFVGRKAAVAVAVAVAGSDSIIVVGCVVVGFEGGLAGSKEGFDLTVGMKMRRKRGLMSQYCFLLWSF